jgi:hypothetical protein
MKWIVSVLAVAPMLGSPASSVRGHNPDGHSGNISFVSGVPNATGAVNSALVF